MPNNTSNNNKLEFYARIKQISTKTLVSGDKSCEIKLEVVPADQKIANKLADLRPEELVKVVYEKK